MRSLLPHGFSLVFLLLVAGAVGQSCTGLCLQQVSCSNGATTTITGTVYAPNGTDPLPNVLVYVPNAPVEPFTPGVSCPAAGVQPSGSPLVGSVTDIHGNFLLSNVPVGANIPIVAKIGLWRRQVTVPVVAACTNTEFSTRLPRTQAEGDIPKIAIVTSATDQMECALRSIGLEDSEFTDPGGTGRINLYQGDTYPGAQAGPSTATETSLMSSPAVLDQYDIVMLPSQGEYDPPAHSQQELSTLADFVNAGGRAYLSNVEYSFLDGNTFLDSISNHPLGVQWWADQPFPNPPPLAAGPATINPNFDEAVQFSQWPQATGVSTTPGHISFPSEPQQVFSLLSPSQEWFANAASPPGAGILQFVTHTPVSAANACGRVVYDGYDVEQTPLVLPLPKPAFPTECSATAPTPQEPIFEWNLFELSPDQDAPLTPSSADFGSENVGLTTAPKTFTWTNNSPFPASASPTTNSADFLVSSSNCASVPGSGTCQVSVAFRPTATGQRTGTLTVSSSAFSHRSPLISAASACPFSSRHPPISSSAPAMLATPSHAP